MPVGFKKKKKKKNQVKSPSYESRVPETGSDPPIGSGRDSGRDNITVYGGRFEECLINLETVLHRCIEKNLVLNWEKCHFMVNQGIVVGHIISNKGIEVDKAKIEMVSKLPSPTNVKTVRQFLGHASFYRRFIMDFSNISKPLYKLLEKDVKFLWDKDCQRSF